MKKVLGMVVVATMMAASVALACDTCGCQDQKAEKKAGCTACAKVKKCSECGAKKKCEACAKKAAKKTEAKAEKTAE